MTAVVPPSPTDLSALQALAKNIQLLVVDIDGTIAGHSNAIAPPVLESLMKVQAIGIPVTIATGRMFCSAKRFHQAVRSPLPLIAYQGAWIQDVMAEAPMQHWKLTAPQVSYLLDYFEQPHLRDRVEVHLYIGDRLHVRDITTRTSSYSSRSGIEPIAVGDLRSTLETPSTKLLALSSDTELIQACLTELKSLVPPEPWHLTTSVATFIEATHPQANKGSAVQYLAETVMGLQSTQVMTIGDNCNDLEMLAYAGIGVAMGDAPAIVKEQANWVTGSAEEHGVAQIINALLLSDR
jgi:Cof subfamily protein (haloacid dehalogenase superfamily)